MDAKNHSTEFSIVTVASGAKSLRSEEHAETFHPVVGPMEEARSLHVGQSRLLERAAGINEPLVVWDIGLGAAANAIAVLEAWRGNAARLDLHSFDSSLRALAFARRHSSELGYLQGWEQVLDTFTYRYAVDIGPIRWRLHVEDFREVVQHPPADAPHAILYDPYSPAANPGMWTLEHFTRLRQALDPARPCTLTSYSRSTSVRVTLGLAGFYPGRGNSTGEKDETTLAATHREFLQAPLESTWLERVRRSTRGAPLREGQPPGPISDTDFAALARFIRS